MPEAGPKTAREVSRVSRLCSLVLLIAVSACGGGGGGSSTVSSDTSSSLLLGAHYYVWFPSNFRQGYLRDRLEPEQGPLLGEYNSTNPQVAEQHINWAAEYGIDFFTLDYWPNRPRQNAAIEQGFLAARNLDRIKFCIFYETIDLNFISDRLQTDITAEAKAKFLSDMDQIAQKFFSHPQYLKVDGRPVIFFYVTRTLTGQYREAFSEARARLQAMGFNPFFIGDEIYWISATETASGPINTTLPSPERIALFDAITSYNMYAPSITSHAGFGVTSTHLSDVRALYEQYRQAAPQVPIVPGLIPGYNDRGHRPGLDHFPIARAFAPELDAGSMLREFYNQVGRPYLDSKLKMAVVTSFNEWNEDTAIEPHAPAVVSPNDDSGGRFTTGLPYGGSGFEGLEAIRAIKSQP